MPTIKAKRTRTVDKTARKKSGARKSSPSGLSRKTAHGWVASVHTESTFPPKGLFATGASTIARNLASKRTSPKGPSSGMRMLNYHINRAGHNLPASRKAELKRAKAILSDIIAKPKKTTEKKH